MERAQGQQEENMHHGNRRNKENISGSTTSILPKVSHPSASGRGSVPVPRAMGHSERRHGGDKEEGSGKNEGSTGVDAAPPAD